MRSRLSLFFLALFLFVSYQAYAEKVVVPITTDGAWSMNNQPSSVYHNGKYFFSWITKSGALRIASYDENTDQVSAINVAGGYASEDCAAPSLLIRASGQILVFASKNGQETDMQCYRSTSTTGDVTAGFTVSNLTGYGISQTLPFAVGNHIVLLWRSKNNLGYTYYKDGNSVGATGGLSAGGTKRTGFLGDAGFGNNYSMRDEVPLMRAVQDASGNIHIVVTQLGTGLKFSNSTIHYLKATLNTTTDQLDFFKASGAASGSITYAAPPEVIYTSQATDKAYAYDITLIDGKPAVLYDAFNGNNVNAGSNPGKTSNHNYIVALWNGTAWTQNTVASVGEGLQFTQYSAVGSTFFANSYQSGGICFDTNPMSVYVSKKELDGTFELYKYESADSGVNWAQTEALSSATPIDQVNIRPLMVKNAPANTKVDLIWLRGSYTNPKTYSTQVMARGEAQPVSSIAFEDSQYYTVVDNEIELKPKFSPLFVANRNFTLVSDQPTIVAVTPEGKLKGLDVGTATITATANSNPSITATCQVIVEGESVFDKILQRVVDETFAQKVSSVESLNAKVAGHLSNLQANGSFPGINYKATDRTDWPPMTHLDRMVDMALGYVYEGSAYYQDATLKAKLDLMLSYWQSQNPTSNNWYQNEIGEPQRMGLFLILVQYMGAEKLNTTYYNNAITRMRTKGGDPGAQAGANRVDVALHWFYRACLTQDRELITTALDYIYGTLVYTTGSEGIQYDNSFTQHGRQLHIGAYGDVFMDGGTKAASYVAGTVYALSAEKQKILSRLVKDTYISVLRGNNIFFNAIGRSSTRPGATRKTGSPIIERMKLIDPDNVQVYEDALARLKSEALPSYGVPAKNIHFYKSDYTVHQRPDYSVDLRLTSTRTARNEYLKDNGEGIKQYFLSDGATGIFVNGDEYYNIMPVWNWAKIPGTTTAELPNIPQANSYILTGASAIVGGVSDSLYAVSVYKYTDSYSGTNYAGVSSSSANKAYFFFDKEVVCLGNNIRSTSEYQVNTTVNQTLLKGDVSASVNGTLTTIAQGVNNYNNTLDWIYHNNVAYYFPKQGNLDLSTQPQSGSWLDINTSYTEEGTKTQNVFNLSFNHGVKPTQADYAYVIVPGIADVAAAQAYSLSDIHILANNDSVQAVYNKDLKILGIVFYKACSFKGEGIVVDADDACVVLIKDADQQNPVVHIADPQNRTKAIRLGIYNAKMLEPKTITYQVANPYQGSSTKTVVSNDLPAFSGKDVLLNRADWTIRTSSKGPVDLTVAVDGDVPEYIIDGDNKTAFLFVKPGGAGFGGVTVPAGVKPWFEIDMKVQTNISFLIYRHRDYNNTTTPLRATKISFYAKNNESDEYQAVLENYAISTSETENRINLPEKINCRYVKVVLEAWDTSTGNTIQISEFNMGVNVSLDFETAIDQKPTVNNRSLVQLSSNMLKVGEMTQLTWTQALQNPAIRIYSLSGMKISELKTTDRQVQFSLPQAGVYILDIRNNEYSEQMKILVR